jgi:hypothetical protein
MRFLRVALGIILIAISLAMVVEFNGHFAPVPAAVLFVSTVFAFSIFVGGVCSLFLGLADDSKKETLESARRLGMGSLTVATLMAGAIALAIVLHLSVDRTPEQPWMEPYYTGVFFVAILLTALALGKAVSLEEWTPPPADPGVEVYDQPDPLEEMVVPDPGPTLTALLARKQSLHLARAR